MKRFWKILVVLVTMVTLAVICFAAGQLISINVDPSIKILVNGQEFHPKDVNGKDVMTFTYNGTTYAPLRALAEAYGLEVGYDSNLKMATVSQPSQTTAQSGSKLGNYTVDILGCRLAKNNDGGDVVIVKYSFTNNGDKSDSFLWSLSDKVYQNGIQCDKAYSYQIDKSYNYDSSQQSREIKPGVTIELEVAYELWDSTSPIEVNVKELISFSNEIVERKLSIQ